MGKADRLSRRPNWQEGVEKDNKDQKLIKLEWIRKAEVLSLSLDNSRTTRGECLGRTRWSSLLDWTTYLYYFYKWLYPTSPRSCPSRMFYNHMTLSRDMIT